MEQKIPKNVIVKRINDWLECYQNTTDEYYNATQFLKDYKESNPDCKKRFVHFFDLDSTKSFLKRYEEKKTKSHCRKSDNGNNQQVKPYYLKKVEILRMDVLPTLIISQKNYFLNLVVG